MLSADRPRYKFSATVLSRICKAAVCMEMTREDKGKTIHSFHSFIYSLLTQQDCALPLVPHLFSNSIFEKFKIFWQESNFHTARYTFSINIFIFFRSVLSESDNLVVSTWSKMEMFTKVDVSESSQFVSETT